MPARDAPTETERLVKSFKELLGPGRPTRDKALMAVAVIMASRSTCPRYGGVGALVARDARILSTGYSGMPTGFDHCTHGPDDICPDAAHAEANALTFAARAGVAVEGAELYTTVSPCGPCARLIINSGIRAVYALMPYRNQSAMMMLQKAGIDAEMTPE